MNWLTCEPKLVLSDLALYPTHRSFVDPHLAGGHGGRKRRSPQASLDWASQNTRELLNVQYSTVYSKSPVELPVKPDSARPQALFPSLDLKLSRVDRPCRKPPH